METYKYCPICREELVANETDGRVRLCCSGCSWINYLNPIPAVACIIQNKSGDILLVKRGVEPKKGEWSLPAGFIELDESPQEAAIRELKEETGIDGRIIDLIGVFYQPSDQYGAVLTVGYMIESIGGELRAGDDVVDVKYDTIKDIDKIPFISHRRMLESLDEL